MKSRAPLEFQFALEMIREQVARSQLLPQAYAKYRPLLADGLNFFLERLTRARLQKIIQEQMTLPARSTTAQRVVALLHHLPALHKLGQVVARDQRLNPGFRRYLQQLESIEPRTPVAVVEEVLRQELGAHELTRLRLAAAPMAEGSVAVVIPFQSVAKGTAPGRRAESTRGLFKLLKPGVGELLQEDLSILEALGDFLDIDAERYHLPHLDYRETFETIRDLLVHEVRLDQEQKHLAEAAQMYRRTPGVKIPALLPGCTRRLTAMEYIDGTRVTSPARTIRARAPDLASAVIRALVVEPLFSPAPAALFHADPHAGNLIATADGRLALIDWALTGRLQKAERVQLMQLMLGAAARDSAWLGRAVETLARNQPQAGIVKRLIEAHLSLLSWRRVPGVVWLTGLLDDLAVRAHVRFSPDLLLYRKVLLTLEGVVTDLTGDAQTWIDPLTMAAFLREWTCEWPARFLLPPNSRALGTHLSTNEIVSLLWLTPMAAWGRWA